MYAKQNRLPDQLLKQLQPIYWMYCKIYDKWLQLTLYWMYCNISHVSDISQQCIRLLMYCKVYDKWPQLNVYWMYCKISHVSDLSWLCIECTARSATSDLIWLCIECTARSAMWMTSADCIECTARSTTSDLIWQWMTLADSVNISVNWLLWQSQPTLYLVKNEIGCLDILGWQCIKRKPQDWLSILSCWIHSSFITWIIV